MADQAVSLVASLLRRWQVVGSVDRAGRPCRQDVAELEARVNRLHARGSRFRHVALSSDVTRGPTRRFASRLEGVCVATEV
jgi:hypothetical protein